MLAVVLYVGSVGPVILFLPIGNEEGYPMVEKIYAPLEWVAKNTPLKEPLIAYATWWRDLKGP